MAVMGDVERVTLDELKRFEAPAGTRTWSPVSHGRVMDMVLSTLDMMRLEVGSMDLAVTKEGQQFFGTLDLTLDIAEGVTLTAGVRNSTDKTFSLGFCCGERVMVCSNLCFGSEINVAKKHTAHVEDGFHGDIIKAGMQLREYGNRSAERISTLRTVRVTDDQADALLLRAFEIGVVGSRQLKPLIQEWREPSYDEFKERNLWSLVNAFTHVMKPRFESTPLVAASESLAFSRFIEPEVLACSS